MSLIVGIDPGASGAAALVDVSCNRVLSIVDFSAHRAGGEWRDSELHAALTAAGFGYASLAVIEQVSAAPDVRQGVSSAFNFGLAYGLVRGLCAAFSPGMRVQLVRPGVWKGALGVPADKSLAVSRAEKEFPGVEFRGPRGGLLDGRAEACLLALFGLRFATDKKPLDLLGHAR